MANTLQWHDLSLKQINQFYDTNKQQNAINLIESWFPCEESSIKKKILYDFYYFILMFSKEINLEPIQTSVFFSIMKKTHEVCISSPYMKLDEDYAVFQKLILTHSIDRPPFSKKFFNLDQIQKITEYATNTYFRHYTMYKYTFTKQQKLTINTIQVKNNEEEKVEEEKEEVTEEVNQENTEEVVEGEGNNDMSVSIVETEKGEKVDEEANKEGKENKEDQVNDSNNTENVESNENEVNNENKENEQEEDKEKEEEKVEEISPREQAILDLKALIESAIGPKIQELKTQLTTMLSNSEDQLIKQIKKIDDAKKKAAKESATAKKDKKGEKEKDKKASAKGKKK